MADKDATGKDRLARNLLSRWIVEAVVIVSGFVVPRLIDNSLGEEQLGIWDFGWTAVSYCRFLGFGMAGGLNRFVALNVAANEKSALRATVSSTIALQFVIATATVLISVTIALSVGRILPVLDPELSRSAAWCVTFLGGTVAIRMLAWPARGILTGQHLWATNAFATLAGDLLALVAMIAVLLLAPSLVYLSLSYMIVTGLTETLRYVAAKRAHPEKLFCIRSVSAHSLKKLFVFGMKTNLLGFSNLVVVQTVSLAVAVFAGPATLAVFARSLALQRHSQVVVRSFAEMLTSTAASMQGLGKKRETRRLFLESMQISTAMTLPIVLLLSFVGTQLITIWMGADYVVPGLLTVLCVGTAFPMSQAAAIRILVGLDEHGRVALNSFLSSAAILLVAGAVATVVGWTPMSAAIVVSLSLTFGYGRAILIGSCRLFEVGFVEYFKKVLHVPLLINAGFFALLVIGDRLGTRDSLLGVVSWAGLCGLVTFVAYWVWLIPPAVKNRLPLARLGGKKQG